MKKFKNLKYVAIICVLMAFNSCSNDDNSLEIIEESSIEELNAVATKSGSSCDTQIAVNYNFEPGTTPGEKQAYKVWYRAQMSQYFTICSVQGFGDSCPDSEIWQVNGQEYYGHPLYPNFPKGGTDSSGPGDPDFDPTPADPVFDEDYDPDACWEAKEDNLNDHLSGL